MFEANSVMNRSLVRTTSSLPVALHDILVVSG